MWEFFRSETRQVAGMCMKCASVCSAVTATNSSTHPRSAARSRRRKADSAAQCMVDASVRGCAARRVSSIASARRGPGAVGIAEQQQVREQEGQERGVRLDGEGRRLPHGLLRRGEASQPPLEVPLGRDKAAQLLEGAADPPLTLDVDRRIAAAAAEADDVATHPEGSSALRAQIVVGADTGQQRRSAGPVRVAAASWRARSKASADPGHAVALRRDQGVPQRDLEVQLQPSATVVLGQPAQQTQGTLQVDHRLGHRRTTERRPPGLEPVGRGLAAASPASAK